MRDFLDANRSYLIFLSGGVICLYATILYYRDNESERIYRQFRGAIESDLPMFRSRSVVENNLVSNELDIAMSKQDYLTAVDHLEDMILVDSNNMALKYYTAILHEQ